tara:strand:- start:83 stop:466 length:384 start_codon:yes stop_codon:yes gene_type:complete
MKNSRHLTKTIKTVIISMCLFLAACAGTGAGAGTGTAASVSEPVWIDVRTIEEYSEDHIDGDLNLPLVSLDVEEVSSLFSKDEAINLYCRSGNRAGQAKLILEAAGFTNVNNMGGIDQVREIRNLPK